MPAEYAIEPRVFLLPLAKPSLDRVPNNSRRRHSKGEPGLALLKTLADDLSESIPVTARHNQTTSIWSALGLPETVFVGTFHETSLYRRELF
ncbi:MAG: hypothetical protein ACAF41_04465 [Leptolyngbya sp. BL-A-14]